MNPVPTVNIIMAYDSDVMRRFQESASFEIFAKEHSKNEEVTIFSNSPQSNFISLTHSIGMGSSSKGSQIEIEFVDPEGLFEEKMLGNSVEDLTAPENNIAGQALEKKLARIISIEAGMKEITKQRNKLLSQNNQSNILLNKGIDRLKRDNDSLADELVAVKEEAKKLEALLEEGAKTDIELLKLQIQAAKSQITRPVYITYGLGDNLLDWAPAQCFSRVVGVEYNFNGQGARTIKLIYQAVGIHPNLTAMGISPLGAKGIGTVTRGESEPMFNIRARQDKVTKFSYLASPIATFISAITGADTSHIDKAVGGFWRPSIHLAVKEAMTSYIARGTKTSEEGVIVLLPNLDELLKKFMLTQHAEALSSMSGWITKMGRAVARAEETISRKAIAWFAAMKGALEELGLQLSESRSYPDERTVLSPVGENVWQNIEECEETGKVFGWFQTRKFSAVCQCDNVTKTFQDKLNEVGKSLSKVIDAHNDDAPAFAPTIYVETDFNMLQIMKKHGLISAKAAESPVILWGDKYTIASFLEARILEEDVKKAGEDERQLTIDQQGVKALKQKLHLIDILKGLDGDYMKDVLDYAIPIPWIGAFGPAGLVGGEDDLFLPDDVNMAGGESFNKSLNQLKQSQPYKSSRMPVFSFGTKNPNVLDIAIDINSQYMSLINNSNPIVIPAQQLANAIIPKKYKSMTTAMFGKIKDLNLEDYDKEIYKKEWNTKKVKVPLKFKPLVDPFFDADWWNGDDIDNFDAWEEIFNNLGAEGYTNMQDDVTFTGEDTKQQFYVYLWGAFQALIQATVPKSDQQIAGKDSDKAAIVRQSKIAEGMAREAFVGSITTLPMFSLASQRRAVMRTCLLYCVEPRFTTAPSLADNTTWFTGLYMISGFKHMISGSQVTSEFLINRSPMRGGQLIRKSIKASAVGGSF